jgi:hypothetical protein
MSNPENLPAFPVLPPLSEMGSSPSGYPYPDAGMTLRDYFAAKAMAAMVGSEAYDLDNRELAASAYAKADAMLKRRAHQ